MDIAGWIVSWLVNSSQSCMRSILISGSSSVAERQLPKMDNHFCFQQLKETLNSQNEP
jgi:hypothetical protein